MKKIIIYSLFYLFALTGCTTQTHYFSYSGSPSAMIGVEAESKPGFFTRKDKRIIRKFFAKKFNRKIHQKIKEISIDEKIPETAGRLPLPADLRRKISSPDRGFTRYQVVNTIVSVDVSSQLIVDKIELK